MTKCSREGGGYLKYYRFLALINTLGQSIVLKLSWFTFSFKPLIHTEPSLHDNSQATALS